MTAKNRIAKYLWTFIKYFSLILAGFIAVLPVASCVITAFKTPEEYASTNVMTLPGKFYFKNFIEAFQKANMGIAFFNSLIILVTVLFFSIGYHSDLQCDYDNPEHSFLYRKTHCLTQLLQEQTVPQADDEAFPHKSPQKTHLHHH